MLNHCVVHLKLKQYCMSVVIKNKNLKSVSDHLDKSLHGFQLIWGILIIIDEK